MNQKIRPNKYDPETDSGDGFQYTYDHKGRVLTVVDPDGHVLQSNTYDGAAGWSSGWTATAARPRTCWMSGAASPA